MAESKPKMATIHITDDTHRGHVEGAHNGVRFRVPVGSDVEVNEGTFIALRDSGIKMNIIEPLPGEDADEGSSASSTVEGTAIRDATAAELGNAGEPREPATLSQRPDPRTNEQKEELQLANVTDPTDPGTAATAGARGLAVDESSAKAAPASAAKAPAKARTTSAKRASTAKAGATKKAAATKG